MTTSKVVIWRQRMRFYFFVFTIWIHIAWPRWAGLVEKVFHVARGTWISSLFKPDPNKMRKYSRLTEGPGTSYLLLLHVSSKSISLYWDQEFQGSLTYPGQVRACLLKYMHHPTIINFHNTIFIINRYLWIFSVYTPSNIIIYTSPMKHIC